MHSLQLTAIALQLLAVPALGAGLVKRSGGPVDPVGQGNGSPFPAALSLPGGQGGVRPTESSPAGGPHGGGHPSGPAPTGAPAGGPAGGPPSGHNPGAWAGYPLKVGGEKCTADKNGNFGFDHGPTLTPGGTVTVHSSTVAWDTSNSCFVINGHSSTYTPPPPPSAYPTTAPTTAADEASDSTDVTSTSTSTTIVSLTSASTIIVSPTSAVPAAEVDSTTSCTTSEATTAAAETTAVAPTSAPAAYVPPVESTVSSYVAPSVVANATYTSSLPAQQTTNAGARPVLQIASALLGVTFAVFALAL